MFSPSVFYRKKHNTTQTSLSVFYRKKHITTQASLSVFYKKKHNRTLHRTAGSIWDDNRVHAAPPPVPTSPTPSYTLLTKHRVHLAFLAFSPCMCECQNWVSYYSSLPRGYSVLPTNGKHRKSNYSQNNLKAPLCSIESTVEAIDDGRAPPRKTLKSISRSSQISLLAPCTLLADQVCGTTSTLLLLPRLSALLSNTHASTTKLLLSTFDSPESFCAWWCVF